MRQKGKKIQPLHIIHLPNKSYVEIYNNKKYPELNGSISFAYKTIPLHTFITKRIVKLVPLLFHIKPPKKLIYTKKDIIGKRKKRTILLRKWYKTLPDLKCIRFYAKKSLNYTNKRKTEILSTEEYYLVKKLPPTRHLSACNFQAKI